MILTMKKVLTILVAMLPAGNSLSQDLSFSYDGNGHFSFSDSLKNIRARIRGNRPDVYLDNEDATLSFNSQGMAGILGKSGMTLTFGKRGVTINEIVVTGTRHNTDSRFIPNTITQVSREKLSESHDFSAIPTVTELTPGLFTTSRGILGYGVHAGGAGSMRIRGIGGSSRLLVLIDGQPQFAGLMSHPVPDVYQTMMAERVEVLRGPSSLYYGSNAMGGVINIISRQILSDGINTEIDLQGGSYGTLQAQAASRMKAGRFSGAAGIQYQHTDGHRANSEFSQTAGFLKLSYRFSDKWNLASDLNLTHFSTSNPGPEDALLFNNDYRITRGLASVQITDSYGWTNGALRLFYDWGHHDIDDGTTDLAIPTDKLYLHNDYITGFNLFQTARLFTDNCTAIGIEYQNYGGSAWNKDKATGERTYLVKDDDGNIVRRQSVNDVAAYIDVRQSLINCITLDAGIRMDYHSVVGTEWIPQAGIIFHVSPFDNIKALVSKGFRNPTIKDMFMFPPSTTDLRPERAMNYELSYSGASGKGFSYGANIFYMEGCNLINTVRVDGRPRNVNTGSFYHWGFEVNGNCKLNKQWEFDANYSFLHMNTPLEGSPEHKTYVGVTYRYKNLSVRPSLQYIGNLPLSEGKESIKESYTLFNISATYRTKPYLQLFVNGENLLCQHYQELAGFYMPRATVIGGIRISFRR